MKLSIIGFRLLALFICTHFTIEANAQQLADDVNSQLNDADKKKIEKADNLNIKGDLILSKAAYPGDKQILERLQMGETKELRKIIGQRVDASGYYKDANSEKFKIYQRLSKDLYAKITGDQNLLDPVKKSETNSIELFAEAQSIRKVLEKKSKLSERLPLLFEVEEKEKTVITQLQRIIYAYVNHPDPYNNAWFDSSNTTQEIKPDSPIADTLSGVNIVGNKVVPETITPNAKIDSNSGTSHTLTPESTGNDSSLYMLANVSEDQIDTFNTFLQKKYPANYEDYIIDFQNIDYSNMESIKEAWYKYRYGSVEDSLVLLAQQPESSTDTIQRIIAQDLSQSTDNNRQIQQYQKDGKKSVAKTNKSADKKLLDKNNSELIAEKNRVAINTSSSKDISTGKYTNYTKEPIAKGFLFKVQIAASRVILNDSILSSIYIGHEKIIQTYEDGWYKYTIGDFDTYREARKHRDQTSVTGVFVVAYLNEKRIKITPAVASNRQIDYEITNPEGIDPEKIEFRLQLLASKVPMDDAYLKNIYSGTIKIDVIEEDGLIKYSLLAGNTLSDALDLYKSINVPESFVVTYYNKQKLNLRTAIKLTRKL